MRLLGQLSLHNHPGVIVKEAIEIRAAISNGSADFDKLQLDPAGRTPNLQRAGLHAHIVGRLDIIK